MRTLTTLFLGLSVLVGCAGASSSEREGTTDSALSSGSTFTAKGTGYYPSNSGVEGGFVDRKGKKLQTLQQFLAGTADYVSVAMDVNAFGYGQHLRIKELDAKYGRAIDFRVVDTGGAFKNKGRTRMDICTASRTAAGDATINGKLTVTTAADAPALATNDDTTSTDDPTQTPVQTPVTTPTTTDGAGDTTASAGAEVACGTSDGVCNPGGNGAGMICVGGQCVAGCRNDAQCPGVTACVSGQCE